MQKWLGVLMMVVGAGGSVGYLNAEHRQSPLAIVMTNDANANQIKVYDVRSQALLQTLSTLGQGGVGGNARGIKEFEGELVAAVNNGSNSVAVFRREGQGLHFQQVVTTSSAPVSIDFGNGHMYVAGAATVDSFPVHRHLIEGMDGTTTLELAEGGAPAHGSTAQVGVVNRRQLLVTLKTDPTPGTVDVVRLEDERSLLLLRRPCLLPPGA
jgi:hypothetical protein